MKFLIESHSRIGDLAINAALFRKIAASGHRLEVIVGAASAGLLADCDFIARVHGKQPGLAAPAKLYWRLSRIRWDVILLPRLQPRLKPLQILGRSRLLRTCRNMDSRLHGAGAVVYRLSILDGLIDGWQDSIEAGVAFAPDRCRRVRAALGIEEGQRLLTVAPGAHRPERRWPVENFARAVRSLAGDYAQVAVVGSPAEQEICERLAQMCSAVNVAGKMDLADTGALVAGASLHLGNDSGLGHVAAGNGVATLAVGGDSRHYVPWRQHMIPGAVNEISVDQVVAQLRRMQEQ